MIWWNIKITVRIQITFGTFLSVLLALRIFFKNVWDYNVILRVIFYRFKKTFEALNEP